MEHGMQSIIYSLKGYLSFKNFPILTILANVFWGYALGKTLVTPSDELGGSLLIKVFLIIGTCLFANYLMCLRKAFRGVSRNSNGKLRPILREASLCAVLNFSIFSVAITLFFIKPYIL
jgi:hypothetical protein